MPDNLKCYNVVEVYSIVARVARVIHPWLFKKNGLQLCPENEMQVYVEIPCGVRDVDFD